MSTKEIKKIRQHRLENLYTVSYFDGNKGERVILQFQTKEELDCTDVLSDPFTEDVIIMDEQTLSNYVKVRSYKEINEPITDDTEDLEIKTLRGFLFGEESVRIFDTVMTQLNDQLKKEKEIFKEKVKENVEDIVIQWTD